jgi:hypothetical protein
MLLQMPNTRAIKVSEEIYTLAKWTAEAERRTISGQVEYWARIGRVAIDNPDLPIDFLKDVLISKTQDRSLAESFIPE